MHSYKRGFQMLADCSQEKAIDMPPTRDEIDQSRQLVDEIRHPKSEPD